MTNKLNNLKDLGLQWQVSFIGTTTIMIEVKLSKTIIRGRGATFEAATKNLLKDIQQQSSELNRVYDKLVD